MTEPTTAVEKVAAAPAAISDFDPDNVFAQAKTRRGKLIEENAYFSGQIVGLKGRIAANKEQIAKLDRIIRAETPRRSPTKKAP